jgi:hypothetical protein
MRQFARRPSFSHGGQKGLAQRYVKVYFSHIARIILDVRKVESPRVKPDKDVTMIRLVVTTLALAAALSLPARAEVTLKSQDGTMQLTLPNGWKESKGRERNAKLQATDGRGASIVISEHPKEDFKDLKTFGNFLNERMKKIVPDADPPKMEDTQIDGKNAIRMTIKGTLASGQNVHAITTAVETEKSYLRIMVRATASNFSRQKQVLEGLPNQLKIAAAGGSAATATPAQPQQPAPAPAQPPRGRAPR